MKCFLKIVGENYVNFNGRASREEYWMFTLFSVIFSIVALAADNIFGTAFTIEVGSYSVSMGVGWIYVIYILALIRPALSLLVRRLHDTGKSGWFYFITLIPLVGPIWILIILCTDSDPGENNYGLASDFNLKKGHDLKMLGEPDKMLSSSIPAENVYLHPMDFFGIKPKLLVKQDDIVSVGSPIFFDKLNPEVKFVSPISGMVSEIQFGERRVIEKIVIKGDGKLNTHKVVLSKVDELSADDLKSRLTESGLWPSIRQLPFSKIANPSQVPRDIFVSVLSTAPFAVDYAFVLGGREKDFQAGLDSLAKLTNGSLHLNMSTAESAPIFTEAKNVKLNRFSGPHPAGNIGIQIHHLAPISSKRDIVWYLNPQAIADIGEYLRTGNYPTEKIITIGGSSISKPAYYKITTGSSLKDILVDMLNSKEGIRIISGDVLSGKTRLLDQGIRFYDETISVIPESTEREFLGWALPGFKKYSLSRTFLSALVKKQSTTFDTSMNGSHRAIVSFGRWESVLPMDILPEFLVKSILANDIEEMEKLGIYECAEEDFALCAFVCQSKTDVSGIIRSGLQLAEKEG